MEVSGGASSSLSKWQVALVIGAPIALGLGYMYYRNADTSDKKANRCKPKKIMRLNGEKQPSIDDDFSKDNETSANVRFFRPCKTFSSFHLFSYINLYALVFQRFKFLHLYIHHPRAFNKYYLMYVNTLKCLNKNKKKTTLKLSLL
jgi:hypothetical protein